MPCMKMSILVACLVHILPLRLRACSQHLTMERLFAQSRLLLRAPKLCRFIHRPVWQNKRALVPHFTAAGAVHRSVSSWGPSYAAVQLATQGKNLVMKTDGEEALLHPTWLRHNCQCPSCMSCEQKIMDPSEINPSITVESAELSGDRLELEWSSGHKGYIEVDWLQKRRPGVKQPDTDPKLATEMPVMSSVGLTEDKEKLWQWLHYLNEYGICILTDFGSEVGGTKKLIEKTMYNVQPTLYGDNLEVLVTKNSISTAYTEQALGYHMDQQYYESSPGLQLLHCIQFDQCVEGGESVMLDMYSLVEEMREKHPEHFNTLSRVPATFERVHYERDEPLDVEYRSPHISLDKNGKVVAMRWTPTMEGALDVPYEDIQPYYDAHYCLSSMIKASEKKLHHRLQPGEVMSFNNRRFVHSRTAFSNNGGIRYLQGHYVNIDHFKSAYQVVCRQLGKDTPIKRVFNMASD